MKNFRCLGTTTAPEEGTSPVFPDTVAKFAELEEALRAHGSLERG